MKKLLMIIVCISSNLMATEWVDMFGSREFFIDKDSIKDVAGNRRANLYKNGNGQDTSFEFFMEFDCINERTRILNTSIYEKKDIKGKILSTNHTPEDWKYPTSGVYMHVILQGICGTLNK